MENKILFVGGNWDLNGGKQSKIVNEFSKYLPNATTFNGGNYNDLNKILESCINCTKFLTKSHYLLNF